MEIDYSKPIVVLGAGNFGTCLAQHLASIGRKVVIWARSKVVSDGINKTRKNPKYLTNFTLHPNISAISHLKKETFLASDAVVLAVPTQNLRTVLGEISAYLQDHLLICAAKGIELNSLSLTSHILESIFGNKILERSSYLSGPSFAIEVMQGQPTAVTVASYNRKCSEVVQTLFHSPKFRVYTSEDPIGIEISGALKNVIAIAAGSCVGLGYKSNSLAALITRGLAELSRLGEAMGADPLTFNGLAGVGDLILTCSSSKSRNFKVGISLAQGKKLKDILGHLGSVAEGVATTKAAYTLGQKFSVRLPIVSAVYKVLYNDHDIKKVVSDLISGEAREERE